MNCKCPRQRYLLSLLLATAIPIVAPLLAAQTPLQPSSRISAIDARTGVVSARVNATGEEFQFRLNNSALLDTLKIGQGVYANFQAKQVSLDGQHVAGTIVSIGPAKGPLTPAAPSKAPSTPPPPQPGTPAGTTGGAPPSRPIMLTGGTSAACCGITSTDARARLVAAKVNSTGQAFEFSVPDSVPIQNLHAGQPVWANFKLRKVSLDGGTACCDIVSSNAATEPGPQPSTPSAPTSAASPTGSRPQEASYRQVDPCTIASADSLKALLQAGIQNYFPIAIDNGGEHIRITKPTVEQVTCPHMTMNVHADFGYEQTQGFPQFQTGGSMELQSSLVVDVTFTGGVRATESAPITAGNFVRATAVLSNPQVTSVQIQNVPSWVDLTFVADCLNGKYSNLGCTDILHAMSFDVTALVKLYLDQGNTIPANSQTSTSPAHPPLVTSSSGKSLVGTSFGPSSTPGSLAPANKDVQPSPGSVAHPVLTTGATGGTHGTVSAPGQLLCSATAPLRPTQPQVPINQPMQICFQVTPQPVQGSVLRVQEGSTFSMNARVTGLLAGKQSLQYKFSVLSVRSDGSQWELTIQDFSSSPQLNWQLPDEFDTSVLAFRVSVQGSTSLGRVQGTGTAGSYLAVNDSAAASVFLDEMGVVMLHPRCSNCHANGDVPTQGDDRHLHLPPVTRQTNCQQCHGNTNGTGLGSPPGAPGWRMAPFAFAGKTADQLCAQLKDPARNGGRTLQGLADHLAIPIQSTFDPLAAWAYNPGPGRTPVPGGDLVDGIWSSFEKWINYGAGCPAARQSTQPTLTKGPTGTLPNAQTHLISQLGCSSVDYTTANSPNWPNISLGDSCQGDGGYFDNYLEQWLVVGVKLSSPAPDTGLDIPLSLSPPAMSIDLLSTPTSVHFEPRTSSALTNYRVQAVAKDTTVTVTARDPVSGKQYSTTLQILAPQPVGFKFLDASGQEITEISAVPTSGTSIKLKTYYTAVTPAGGMPVNISYGGTTNVNGPCGVNPNSPCSTNVQTQLSPGDKPSAFISLVDLVVSPCASAPCQVTVSAGSQTAMLKVNQ